MSDGNEMLRENLEAQSAQTRLVDKHRYLQELKLYYRGDMTGKLRERTGKVSKMLAGASLATKLELKHKLNEIERNMKLGKLSLEVGNRQKLEVLTALRHLGCELTDSDKMFVREETRIIELQSSTPSDNFDTSDS